MIRFTRIRIQDYKSIQDVTLQIEPGLYRVIGKAKGYSSNGSGKTTVTQAIVLALFNRDFSGAKIDEISNRVTGKDFIITLDFMKDGHMYQLINNRRRKTMTIAKNSHTVASGYKECGTMVTTLLGMGYETFVLTHFITSKTVNHITENLSNPALFNDILQIAQLKDLDKKFLELSKELKQDTANTQQELNNAETVANTLKLTERFDIANLSSELASLEEERVQLTMHMAEEHKRHTPGISLLKAQKRDLQSQIANITDSIDNGVCPTCETLLVSKENISALTGRLDGCVSELEEVTASLDKLEDIWDSVYGKLDLAIGALDRDIAKVKADLRVAEEIEVSTSSTSYRTVEDIKSDLDKLQQLTRYVSYTREQIKEGNVVKELLENFFEIVSIKMQEYGTLINMNGLDVEVVVNKLGMGVVLHRGEAFIPVSTLSNGEKTRLSLLVLISMLAAMKEVSNAETNYLVFDEASASFDASGIDELEALFSYMKNMGQACFVITHGNEMAKVSFDHEILVSKTGGISNVTSSAI